MAFRLTAVATISREVRNTNAEEEEEAGISSFPKKELFVCVCVPRGQRCALRSRQKREEIDFWREREVQKQPWCDDDDDDDAEERACFCCTRVRKIFFLFHLPLKIILFIYLILNPNEKTPKKKRKKNVVVVNLQQTPFGGGDILLLFVVLSKRYCAMSLLSDKYVSCPKKM